MCIHISVSEKCPDTHPYTFHDGSKCCAHFVRSSSCGTSGKLQFEDPVNCCDAVNTLDCPSSVTSHGRVCTSLSVGMYIFKTYLSAIVIDFQHSDGSSGECPAGHSPLIFGSKCCSYYKRSVSCPESGALEASDPIECCDGTAVRLILCAFNRELKN